MTAYKAHGFTLIELVIVIVIIGILGAMSTELITLPVNSYLNLKRRTTLVDTADITLRRMQRDVRRALPNSIRITDTNNPANIISGNMLEVLHTSDGGRYRAAVDTDLAIAKEAGLPIAKTTCTKTATPDLADDNLDFDATSPPDACFEVMGSLTSFDPTKTNGEFLYIYNATIDVNSAYLDMSNQTSNRRRLTSSPDRSHITFTPSLLPFPNQSPNQLFAIVDTPVTYFCDLVNHQLLRYDDYTIQYIPDIPTTVTGQLQANKIANCVFTYNPTDGLVSLEITLQDSVGDKVTLMHQLHVDNGS